MANDNDWLEELAKRSGAGVGETDLANLQGKNQEDRDMFKQDLEAQYARRGASQTRGSGPEGSTVRAPSDYAKGFGPGGSNENPMGNRSVAQQWTQGSSSGGGDSTGGGGDGGRMGGNTWQNQDPRADALYQQLLGRSQQGLAMTRNDPAIRGQADAYSAQEDRSRRNYLGDVAERSGPNANLRGEERMAAERQGQRVGGFEAELMGRELGARRQEIAQALSSMQGMLSADQQAALQREMSALDAAIRREGMGQQNDQFNKNLALNEWDRGNYWDYSWAGM